MLTIIGDAHGKVDQYKKIIDSKDFTIQLGDFGFKQEHEWFEKNVKFATDDLRLKHMLLPGNHDYPPYDDKPWVIGRSLNKCMFEHSNRKIFCIGGGASLNKDLRIEGLSWFQDEELSLTTMFEMMEFYEKHYPQIVITHVPPDQILKHIGLSVIPSRTGQFLSGCFDIWQPSIWVFGHMHMSIRKKVGKTLFIGLDELEVLDENQF